MGRRLLVRGGTMRPRPDYDDAWFLACARHAGAIFDIGANVGYSAILALQEPAVREVVLVEANPAALAVAAENLILNGFSARARFVAAFAADAADGSVDFWTVGTGAAGSVFQSHARSAVRRDSSIRIPTVTVDALCDRVGFRPDFVKVDVEGSESKVLEGSRKCARHCETRFLVEMHANDEMSMSDNSDRILSWCTEAEYQAWYMKDAVRLAESRQIAHRGRCHLLLQPASWNYPDWLSEIRQSAALEPASHVRDSVYPA